MPIKWQVNYFIYLTPLRKSQKMFSKDLTQSIITFTFAHAFKQISQAQNIAVISLPIIL